MKAKGLFKIVFWAGALTVGLNIHASYAMEYVPDDNARALLGKSLFFDTRFSLNQTQSCATCHDPAHGFSDQRDSQANRAFSLGDDGKSFGDRNAPSAGYAAFTPIFHQDKEGNFIGGQFWDGRASTLEDQAAGPPLNPIEMAMPSKELVMKRAQESSFYVDAFESAFGKEVFNSAESFYSAFTQSIAQFERTKYFAPFDSKYDRYLQGKYKPTEQEELGMTLFFSQQFTNCHLCHQLNDSPTAKQETFSNYSYHNIGVPTNTEGRKINKVDVNAIDVGLRSNPLVNSDLLSGKFKVPTLRNVAVTGPYMHNGVFQDLKTVILFYNKYNSQSEKRQINPETGQLWSIPEHPQNISLKELEHGPALDDERIDALVAFMRMLTDRRYEHLLE